MGAAPRERRRRGSGTVYEDPERGGWVASLPVSSAGGKRVRKRARAASRSEALRALERLRERWAPERDAATLTVGEWLDSWLQSVRSTVRPGTYTSYAGHVSLHIAPLLGGIPLRDLRPADVRRLERELLAKKTLRGKGKREDGSPVLLSPNTAARIETTLRIALAAAVREQLVPSNTAVLTGRLPRAERPEVEAMTGVNLSLYIEAFRPTSLGPLVRLIAGSGVRLGEALGLDQVDADPDGRTIRLRKSKTRIRTVPITPDAAQALRDALAKCPVRGDREPLFWSTRRGRDGAQRGRLSGWTVSHAVPDMAEALGLPRITPHGFRHAAATLMVTRGVHMRVVAAQLGHANPAMTARVYAHVVPESQRDAADLLAVKKA
jgi:integrase